MNQQQTGLAFASLGVASLAVAGSCLYFIEPLGGLSYVGATLAVFLAMLCGSRFAVLHRAVVTARPVAAPVAAKPRWESTRSKALSAREESEDEVIESRMAALNAAVEDDDAPSTLPPQRYESTSFFAPIEGAPESSSVVVTEEPLDPALAQQFADFRPEQAVQMEVSGSVTLRQMEDIRAQIARLREESRVRHAANSARTARRLVLPVAAPVHALVPDAPARPDAPAADPFARTEFSGLPGSQSAGFARTEFLTPVELPR